METYYPTNIYLFKVTNKNTGKKCEICSKFTIKTPERLQWRLSGAFIFNLEHILHFFLVFLFSTLNKQMLAGYLNSFQATSVGLCTRVVFTRSFSLRWHTVKLLQPLQIFCVQSIKYMKTPNSTLHFNQDNLTLNKTSNKLASILPENIRQS